MSEKTYDEITKGPVFFYETQCIILSSLHSRYNRTGPYSTLHAPPMFILS